MGRLAAHPPGMSKHQPPRVPAGTPAGGRFAPTARAEPDVTVPGCDRDTAATRVEELLVLEHAVGLDSEQIGHHIGDIDEAAALSARAALDLGDGAEPEARFVAAARAAILEEVGEPDATTRRWTGQNVYWTDELSSVCEAVVDAVNDEQATGRAA